jgi:1,4-alpha-glucan branching enzyme
MTNIHALTQWTDPSLYVWREPAAGDALQFRLPLLRHDEHDLAVFPAELDHQVHEPARVKLFAGEVWEQDAHNRQLPRDDGYRFPDDAWIVEGTRRVLTEDPFSATRDEVVVHLITARKYREGALFLWTPGSEPQRHDAVAEDEHGLVFRIPLAGLHRHLFAFKFVDRNGQFEPEYANRLWCAPDGAEVWVHSQSAHVAGAAPTRKRLSVHYSPPTATAPVPAMHLWQAESDFSQDIEGEPVVDGLYLFTHDALYTSRPYQFKFFWPDTAGGEAVWEHDEASRSVVLENDTAVWTLEGDHELYAEAPIADREIVLEVVDRPPSCGLSDPLTLDVWTNRARHHLHADLAPRPDGTWAFRTYPEVVTSFRFRTGTRTEAVPRHTVKLPAQAPASSRFHVVLDRPDPLAERPVTDLFQDPPFAIERPGVWQRDDELRFALHAPTATAVRLIGEWTQWRARPVAMHSTRDGTFWWASVPVAKVLEGSGRDDYHGVLYKFLIDDGREHQDPAADWVENSAPSSASRLTNHARYQWASNNWATPGWEYLIVYQLHPRRFSRRFDAQGLSPLRQVAEEITRDSGYLRQLGVTAIQLMPVNEFAGDNSWGYGPAFYYAVEAAYGGPDDLKYLVDTCHRHGLAVLLDVVFNHAGTADNVLWGVARDSFFDGDTSWGAMINFDHPQVIHFFEQNLLHLRREYRVDGFRLDHTHTIVHSHVQGGHVTQAGSGGGWDFLHRLRAALHSLDPSCLLVAEHLPNEWSLTRDGGPMDSQWSDDFHDRLVDASRGDRVLPRLADALKTTHTRCDQWYEATNYPESHDEVGNVNDRIANIGGLGQGLRRNKVAAAASLLSRGIPLWFMGAEAGEAAQFSFHGDIALDLDAYLTNVDRGRVRTWWKALCDLRRGNPRIQGPSPLAVHYVADEITAFSRGGEHEYFVVLNFGPWSGWRALAELNLPHGVYRELWNSTWPAFAVEWEDEHTNGGRDARLHRGDWLHIPDYGCLVLERA